MLHNAVQMGKYLGVQLVKPCVGHAVVHLKRSLKVVKVMK